MSEASENIHYFLVMYDTNVGEAEVREFDDHEAAIGAYEEMEREARGRRNLDIVLLGADSLDTIKRTHSSYFETTQRGFERFFADALMAASGT